VTPTRITVPWTDRRLLDRAVGRARSASWRARRPGLRGAADLTIGWGAHLTFLGAGRLDAGPGLVIGHDFTGVFLAPARFGRDVFVNRGAYFAVFAGLTVGDRVRFGERVSIHDENHVFEPLSRLANHRDDYDCEPVVIGDDCWIGANVTILPGSVIGARTVIAAGAVVRGEIPADVVAGGTPAKVLRPLQP
jgi:acetyltransferase-like isoleucine patch superfamily enzyme